MIAGIVASQSRPVSQSADPYWSSVVSLLQYQGANGSTTFTDDKGRAWSAAGNAALSTARSKIGSSSLYLDGVGDAITTPTSVDFDFGSGDFTIEGWAYAEVTTSGWLWVRRNTTSPFTSVGLLLNASSQLRLVVGNVGGTNYDIDSTGGTVPLNTWFHWSVHRSGSAFAASLAGTVVITATRSGSLRTLSESVALGAASALPDTPYFKGNRGWDRVTKGVCRYPTTGSFTPPASP